MSPPSANIQGQDIPEYATKDKRCAYLSRPQHHVTALDYFSVRQRPVDSRKGHVFAYSSATSNTVPHRPGPSTVALEIFTLGPSGARSATSYASRFLGSPSSGINEYACDLLLRVL
jgi:hypothetical protein